MANLLAEVDEALKQEKVAKFWSEYGGFVLALVVLVILGTAALSGYRLWDNGVKAQQTEKFLDALSSDDEAEALVRITKDLRPDLKTIALWEAAGAWVKKGEKEKALETYKQIANDAAAPVDFRHLAIFQSARLVAQHDPETGLPMLERVANDENNPWNDLARLDVAVLQAHYKKNYKVAREHLATLLKRESLPQSLERKVRSLDMLYELESPDTETEIAPASGSQEQTSDNK
ncbi:MAG: tetratricopeptide repeat protein [Alphaproteobacteria bacterium]|nr:tetratricopeptide repeat protein [Alphaproteobacteria bacterium]